MNSKEWIITIIVVLIVAIIAFVIGNSSSKCPQLSPCDNQTLTNITIPKTNATTTNQTNCVEKTCAQLGKTCGSWNNGCNTSLNCGSCNPGYSCNTNGACMIVSNQTITNQTQTNQTVTCTDSDGMSTNVTGTVIYNKVSYTDYCNSTIMVREYYCTSPINMGSTLFGCSRGCSNGRCL